MENTWKMELKDQDTERTYSINVVELFKGDNEVVLTKSQAGLTGNERR